MEANPVRIVQYFDGEKQSIIPLFQRPYTWGKRNWQSLWLDIMSYYDDAGLGASHFMGAVVSIPAKTVPVGVTKHLVIDGQQRLTTVAIFLCALRDCGDERRAAQIQDYLVNRHYDVNSPDFLKLLPTQGDRASYLQVINGGGAGTHTDRDLVKECYDFFVKSLSGKDDEGEDIDPGRVFDIVKSCLQVVMINLGEADDPYLIFESLNFKGEPLSQSDLVRNYVLMRFRHSLGDGGEQERVYKEIWHPMESRLAGAMEDFLWHYSIKDGDNVKKTRIYTVMKQKLSESKAMQEVEEKICRMNKASISYVKFLFPEKEANALIRRELMLLRKLEATISYPILIKLFAARDDGLLDDGVLLRCLKYINSFIVRRAVCNEKRSALNKLFVSIAAKVPKDQASVDEWMVAELVRRVRSERWPDDEEFRSAIKYNNLYGTKAARIVLDGIESYLAGKEVVDLDSGKITIEHVMPQKISDEWRREAGSGFSDEMHVKCVDTLGNLTLTGFNSELGNAPFSEKKKKYNESGISMNRDLCKYDRWTEVEIFSRGEQLAEYAMQIWSRPV